MTSAQQTRELQPRKPAGNDPAPTSPTGNSDATTAAKESKHSPDPMQQTDRYRLVTPYTLRL